jgi:hypothetical protein
MNNVLDLFKGVGVIIDDDLNPQKGKTKDEIWKIKKSFEDKNIPILEYYELPYEKVANFHSISFLLLDWDLYALGDKITNTIIQQTIDFITDFNKVCFAPIFIFSNESPDDIKLKLSESKLYDDTKSNHIFIKSKSDLQDVDLFTVIEGWLKQTPSVYVLKEWNLSLQQAKNDLFWDFYNANSSWPSILKQTFKTDGVDENHELCALIYKNLIARTNPPEFDEEVLNTNVESITKDDLRKVLECERFLKKDKLSDMPATGDIFTIQNTQNNESQYFINIRPDCDIIRNSNVELYCLKGRVVDENKINNSEEQNPIIFSIKDENGVFEEKVNHAFVAFINDGKIIEFLFRDIKIKKWNDVKDNRIGRLLPPYITRLQQKYSFYLQRQGLPAIPEKAII